MMKKHYSKTIEKLNEFGKTIGLDAKDIKYAKRSTKTLVSILIIAGIFTLIGIFSSRFDPIGQWYTGVSIKDFFLYGRFF